MIKPRVQDHVRRLQAKIETRDDRKPEMRDIQFGHELRHTGLNNYGLLGHWQKN